LGDNELRATTGLITEILEKRDQARKAKAIVDAKATLAAAGLTLKGLNGNGHKKAAKGPIYHAGHAYQHPADKTLVWDGKGKKPGWLVGLEADGKMPVEVSV
jgi:DNA-binding protein H-NS